MKKETRENNFQHAQNELAKVLEYLTDIENLYFKPLRLREEMNATRKASGYISKAVTRLTKRIDISRKLAK